MMQNKHCFFLSFLGICSHPIPRNPTCCVPGMALGGRKQKSAIIGSWVVAGTMEWGIYSSPGKATCLHVILPVLKLQDKWCERKGPQGTHSRLRTRK